MEQGDGREGLWGMKGGGRVERVCVPADSGQRPQLQKPHGRIGFRPCPAGPTHRVLDSRFFQSVQRECSSEPPAVPTALAGFASRQPGLDPVCSLLNSLPSYQQFQ